MSFKINIKELSMLTAGLLVMLFSCVDSTEETKVQIDRKPLLENLADQVIIPAYTQLDTEVTGMNSSITAFLNDPSPATLGNARSTFIKAYVAWQKVEFFDFGPAFDQTLRAQVNTFPTDNFAIDNAIATGNIQLQSLSNNNKKGFPAIDYLLYGDNKSDADIIADFTTNANASTRKEYLRASIEDMQTLVSRVSVAWNSGEGNYRSTFVERTGTDVGSSLGQLINSLSQSLEVFTRDAKVGIPLGKRSQGILIPKNAEAYYSGNSMLLARSNVQGYLDVFKGSRTSEGANSQSLLAYLNQLNAQYKGGSLSSALEQQFQNSLSKLNQISDPYSRSIEAQATIANEAYLELQKTVVLVKVDLASALGILISYQDNDGD
ncbi:imelysin family protein [Algoriphagus sp. NBT04N3]|uniref:imelysin family protein n=1 Tax=Algoriphagus sp. NBT04N3 TaxID=2705473 RepID=UPI001C635BE8|nr:imelysin family protein [Algoriphagus sp. NBT04N3]QYH39655.1 imelysin family protein [Algoriphagus sp. NBT04N3]